MRCRCSFYSILVFALSTVLTGCPNNPNPNNKAPLGSGSPRLKLTHNCMPPNGLSPDALRANEGVRTTLATQALNDATIQTLKASDPAVFDQTTDELLKYIVSCALSETQTVESDSTTWEGELGLCPGWNAQPPSDDCL